MLFNSLSVRSWVVPTLQASGSYLVGVKPMASQTLTASSTITITHSLNKRVCGVGIVNEANNNVLEMAVDFDPAAASNTITIYNDSGTTITATVFIQYMLT